MKSSYPAYSSASLHADGAALTMKGDWSDFSFRVGATAPTLALTKNCTLAAPVSLDEGVATSTPLVVSGAYQLTCTGAVRLPGGISSEMTTLAFADLAETPVTLGASATLRTTTAPASIPVLVMSADGRLVVGFNGTTPAKVTCGGWTAPSSLAVTLCSGATDTAFATPGTYELLTFPASVDFDASRAVACNAKSGFAYSFDVVTAGETKTLRVTIASDGGSVWTSDTYDTRLYTFAGNGVSNNVVVINGTKNRTCGFEVLGDTTFTHGATGTQGSFMKLGTGTLTFAGPFEYTFGKSVSTVFLDNSCSDYDWFAADGTSRLCYNPFTVANGRLVVGGPGQRFTSAGELWIGTATTSEEGRETTGEFVFNGGVGSVGSYVCIGRNNGYLIGDVDTRPNRVPLRSRFTMNGGRFQSGGLIYGYANTGGVGIEAVLEINGGIFRQVGVNGGRNSVRLGANNYPGSKVWHVQHGGEFSCDDLYRVSQGGCEAHFMADGGACVDFRTGMVINGTNPTSFAFTNATFRCQGAISGSSTKTSFSADGLTYVPVYAVENSDMYVSSFKDFTLGANGLTVDLSEFSGNWCCMPPMSGPGGLVVRGVGDPRTAVAFRGGHGTFEGGVTVCNAGFTVTSNYCATLDVRLHEGGALIHTVSQGNRGTLESVVSVKTLTCGADAADTVALVPMFMNFDDGDMVVPFRVNDTLTVNGLVEVAFRHGGEAGRQMPSFKQAQRVLVAPTGSIDASKFRLSPDYPGVTATFRVESFDAGRDVLMVEFSSEVTQGHVWQVGNGAWTEAANWSWTPINCAWDVISFPGTLAADATVTLDGARTVGRVVNASEHDVTLTDGVLALANDAAHPPKLVSRGGGTLAAPVASVAYGVLGTEGNVALTRQLPPGTTVSHADGILSGAPANFGNGGITVTSGTLRPTTDGAILASVTGAGRGVRVDVPEGVVASQVGAFTNTKCFIKTGRGEYLFAVPGATTLSATFLDMNQGTRPYYLPADGSFPTNGLGSAMFAGGTFTFGRDGQSITVTGSEMWVGGHPVVENGDPQDVTVNMMGGALTVNSYLGIGRNRLDADLYKAMTRRPNYTFNQYAGDVTVAAFIMCWDNTFNQRCLATYNLHDGTMTVGNRFGMGHHECRESATAALGESECVFNVYGGKLLVQTGTEAMAIAGLSNAGRGRMNVYGGTVEVLKSCVYVANNGGQGTLHLAGGEFIARALQRSNASSTAVVIWDGGVYKPATNASAIVTSITSNLVAAGGAKIDTSLYTGAKIALAQTLTHDPACEGVDGGLAKYGTGVLALTQPMAFTGPLAAFGGGISLERANAYAVPAVKGCAAITNGELSVSGYVQPCAENVDTWTAATLEVDSLAFDAGAVWKVMLNDAVTEAATLKVNGGLTAVQMVPLDFARDEGDPLPTTLDVKIAEFRQAPQTLPVFKGVNTGLSKGYAVRTRLVNGVELHAFAVPLGTQIIFR